MHWGMACETVNGLAECLSGLPAARSSLCAACRPSDAPRSQTTVHSGTLGNNQSIQRTSAGHQDKENTEADGESLGAEGSTYSLKTPPPPPPPPPLLSGARNTTEANAAPESACRVQPSLRRRSPGHFDGTEPPLMGSVSPELRLPVRRSIDRLMERSRERRRRPDHRSHAAGRRMEAAGGKITSPSRSRGAGVSDRGSGVTPGGGGGGGGGGGSSGPLRMQRFDLQTINSLFDAGLVYGALTPSSPEHGGSDRTSLRWPSVTGASLNWVSAGTNY
ncbi:hypothetical protein EYF80_030991 [Liparis tanakae]|uniref:Uncharacterized protein n=1 Tax=Liparis tanakae TaxID=230148 RepID=A0A4Z2H1U3_9TELE|nr:hypothetical protein EYF80_030991 [Liparis tanakae]